MFGQLLSFYLSAQRKTFTILVLLLLPVLSHAQLPSTLGWYQIPSSRIRPHCPDPTQYPGIQGNEGCDAVTQDWSGGAFDTSRNQLLITGGGHAGYYGNEIYALNMSTLTMSRLTNPSLNPPTSGCYNDGTMPDGNPTARHWYDHLVYVPTIDRVLAWGGSNVPCGYMVNDLWSFNPGNRTWTRLKAMGTGGPTTNFGRAWAYNPTTQMVYAHDEWNLWQYNPTTNTYTNIGDSGSEISAYKRSAIDPVRNYYVMQVGGRGLYYYNLNQGGTKTIQGPVAHTGCSAVVGMYTGGFVYDSTLAKIVAWDGGNTVYILDTSNWSCTAVTYSGGPGPQIDRGTYGRWQYIPSLNVHVVCNDIDDNCYALRLTSGSGTPSVLPATPTGLQVQ